MTTDDNDEENMELALTVKCPVCKAKKGKDCSGQYEYHLRRLDKAERGERIKRYARSAVRNRE